MNHLPILFAGLIGLLILTILAVVLWQRYYREDSNNTLRRILKNSAVPFVVRLTNRLLEFGFALVLYSTLAPAEIGQYTLAALFIAQYLVTFTEFGLGVLLTREVAKEQQSAPHMFGVTLTMRGLFVLASIPIAALLIGFYNMLGNIGIGEAISPLGQQVIWVLLLTLVPGAYSSAVTALYNATERMEVPAIIELITAIISVIVRIVLLLMGFGILGLAWAAVAVSTCTALIYGVLQTQTFFRPTLLWDHVLMRHLLPLSFPLMLNNLLNIVFFRFDTFIIKAYGGGIGDQLVQQYAVAYQFINIALVLPPVITFAVFPLLSRQAMGDRAKLAQAQNRTLQALLLLAFPIAMGMCMLSPDLVKLITRRNAADYLPISAHVLAILAWFLPLSFVNGLLQYVLIAINQQRVITRAFLIGALFNLIANIITIPLAGLYAASVVTILSEIVLFVVFLPLLNKETLSPPLMSLSWRPLLATLGMGGAMMVVRPFGWLIAASIALPIYVGMLWIIGTFGPEERALVWRILKKQ